MTNLPCSLFSIHHLFHSPLLVASPAYLQSHYGMQHARGPWLATNEFIFHPNKFCHCFSNFVSAVFGFSLGTAASTTSRASPRRIAIAPDGRHTMCADIRWPTTIPLRPDARTAIRCTRTGNHGIRAPRAAQHPFSVTAMILITSS